MEIVPVKLHVTLFDLKIIKIAQIPCPPPISSHQAVKDCFFIPQFGAESACGAIRGADQCCPTGTQEEREEAGQEGMKDEFGVIYPEFDFSGLPSMERDLIRMMFYGPRI